MDDYNDIAETLHNDYEYFPQLKQSPVINFCTQFNPRSYDITSNNINVRPPPEPPPSIKVYKYDNKYSEKEINDATTDVPVTIYKSNNSTINTIKSSTNKQNSSNNIPSSTPPSNIKISKSQLKLDDSSSCTHRVPSFPQQPATHLALPTPSSKILQPPLTSHFNSPPTENFFPFTEKHKNTLEILENLTATELFSTIYKLNLPTTTMKPGDTAILLQMDGRANISICNNLSLLSTYWEIPEYRINVIHAESPVVCTHKGIYNLRTEDNNFIPIVMYYSPLASQTVISLTDAVIQNSKFSTWIYYADVMNRTGYIKFLSPTGLYSSKINLDMFNNLWFVRKPSNEKFQPTSDATIHTLKQSVAYKLWHHILAHPGKTTMEQLHKACDRIPMHMTKPPFFSCKSCIKGKFTSKGKGFRSTEKEATSPGSYFQMDFAFVRGPSKDGKKGHLRTCRNGFNSYLLITDIHTRMMWAFPTATKDPLCDTIATFLEKYGSSSNKNRIVRTDLGGELAKSSIFRDTIRKAGFVLEVTAPNSSFQNCIVERNHRSLGNMMRCMLLSAGLDSSFWSNALLYSVYIKNQLPHQSLPDLTSPFKAWHNKRPDISHIWVFRSLLYVKTPGIKDGKLDTSRIHSGIFLGFTPSTRNVRYLDKETGRTKTSRHYIVNEAHFSSKEVILPYTKDLLKEPSSKDKPFTPGPSKLRSTTTTPNIVTPVAASLNEEIKVLDSTLYISPDRHGPIESFKVKVKGHDEYLGFHFQVNKKNDIILYDILHRTPANNIPCWKSQLKFAILLQVDSKEVSNVEEISLIIEQARKNKRKDIIFKFALHEKTSTELSATAEQLTLDQFATMAYQHNATINNSSPWMDQHNAPSD